MDLILAHWARINYPQLWLWIQPTIYCEKLKRHENEPTKKKLQITFIQSISSTKKKKLISFRIDYCLRVVWNRSQLLNLKYKGHKLSILFWEKTNWAILASEAHNSKALQHHNGTDVQWVKMIKEMLTDPIY